MKEMLLNEFINIFGEGKDIEFFFSPGRVNLIGEHIDYNGGYVFPCALDFGTYAGVRKREDKLCRFYSLNFKNIGIVEFNIDEIENIESHDWANYPKGVIKMIKDFGCSIDSGFEILFYGNIPNGAGLSSSASIEVLTGTILKEIFNLNISKIDIVKLSQKAENQFIGVNCGIMDQFAIGMGKKDNAILLDCNTLDYEYAPLVLEGASIVIGNTNKRRGLGESKYNERRASCEEAVRDLNCAGIEYTYLCEINSMEEFYSLEKHIKSAEGIKRAKHAVSENIRVKEAMNALNVGDIATFGKLMNESHISLRDDYEVTGVELDSLVEASWEEEGVIGSRMTGAGFGGCIVSIVKDENIDSYIKNVGKKYFDKVGLKADFYVAKVGDGAGRI